MAFPATPLNLTAYLALGADLTANPSTWVWTDATAYVFANPGIAITWGGRDGVAQAPPSTCEFTVDNADGRWVPTNPSGAWYGQLRKNTPIRILVDEGTSSVRWTGFLSSLPPRWDPSENFRYVPVQASGIMQRLQRGQTPLRSALVRAFSLTDPPPVAYWPAEDGADSTTIAEFFGGPPMTWANDLTLASAGPTGSSPLPEFTTAAGVNATVPAYASTSRWCVATVFRFPASPSSAVTLLRWFTTGTYPQWEVILTPGTPDVLTLVATDATGTIQINEPLNFVDTWLPPGTTEPMDRWLILAAAAYRTTGSSINYALYIMDQDGEAGVVNAASNVDPGAVLRVNVPTSVRLNGMHAGHWGVWADELTISGTFGIDRTALDGYTGETITDRAVRVGHEQGLPVTTGVASDLTMGPQPQDTFLAIERECEAVGNGRLFETRDPVTTATFLTHRAHTDLENVDAALTLNHDSGHLAPLFEPTDDDQNLINDVTATRSGAASAGSSARVIATEGEYSSLTPDNVGTYDDSVSVNVETDMDLMHQAGWRVNLGTVEGLRFPVVTLDFARNPSLIASWITCDIGSRITITNPPAGIAPDDIDLLIEGWTEIFGPFTWTVQLNCSPYSPWHVGIYADPTGDTDPWLGRAVGDPDCALRVAIDDNDLSMDVDPNYWRWTTTADDFPLPVRLGGEVVTVSSIATGGVTFIAVGAASHADNAAVTPALYAGHTADHVIFVVAAIRSSGTGTLQTPTGYTRLPIFAATDNVQVFAKVHDGTESNPTVTPSGGAAGDTVSAFTFGLGNAPITLADLGDIVIGANPPLLNASAANIAYSGMYTPYAGSLQLIVAWKQDDYTSVAAPAGFTEMIEASTTTGNDQSLYVAYRIDSTPAAVDSGSLVVTGGASAISRSAVVALGGGKQVFTLSARSVNGVVKSHAVGTRVAVDDPGVAGL